MKHVKAAMTRRSFVGASAAALAALALGGCARDAEDAPQEAPQDGAAQDSTPEPGTPAHREANAPQEAPSSGAAAGGAAIAVFSRTGNTLALAEAIQARTGHDLVRIEPAEPYPADYDEMLDVGQREQNEDARPALAAGVPSLAGYDTVYLGFPVWWGPHPADREDARRPRRPCSKTLAPFATSGSSSIAASVSDLRALCPDANVLDGLVVTEANLGNMDALAAEWLAGLGL